MNRKHNSSTLLCITGLFAAMVTLMTGFILHLPYGTNGGYIHFGDAFIFIAATVLPRSYAIAAALIGAGLADLLTAPVWLPATIIIKLLIVLLFSSQNNRILSKRNMFASFAAMPVTVIGYYFAEVILFGSFVTPFASIPGNLIQAAGSIIIFFIVAGALEKSHVQSLKMI